MIMGRRDDGCDVAAAKMPLRVVDRGGFWRTRDVRV
jgi:hypothetical protein